MPKQQKAFPLKERHVGHLNRGHIQLANSARNFWCVTPVAGVKAKDLCSPEFWKHVVGELGIKPHNLVTVDSASGSTKVLYLGYSIEEFLIVSNQNPALTSSYNFRGAE